MPKGQLSLYYPRTHTFCSAFSSLHPLPSSPSNQTSKFCTPLLVGLFVCLFVCLFVFCIPTLRFCFALPTDPCLHLVLHHYTPHSQLYLPPSFRILLLLCYNLAATNNPSINLPTFCYTILCSLSTMLSFPTSTTLVYMLHFLTLQPQTILQQLYPLSTTPNYTYSLLSTTLCYTLLPQL